MKKRFYAYIMAAVFLGLLLLMSYCSSKVMCNQPVLEMLEQPFFIIQIAPVSDSKISAFCYEQSGGIGVEVNGLYAEINRNSSQNESLGDRFELYINDGKISNDLLIIEEDYSALFRINDEGNRIPVGIFSLSWQPELDVGRQRVEVFVIQDNGEKLEYDWEFEITK